MTAPGPFLTIRGVDHEVTVTAAGDRVIVGASWVRDGQRHTTERAVADDWTAARDLAHAWANQLTAGLEPE